MDSNEKLLHFILTRQSDANVPFNGLRQLLGALGFAERIKGDHYIFSMTGVPEILNIQFNRKAQRPNPIR